MFTLLCKLFIFLAMGSISLHARAQEPQISGTLTYETPVFGDFVETYNFRAYLEQGNWVLQTTPTFHEPQQKAPVTNSFLRMVRGMFVSVRQVDIQHAPRAKSTNTIKAVTGQLVDIYGALVPPFDASQNFPLWFAFVSGEFFQTNSQRQFHDILQTTDTPVTQPHTDPANLRVIIENQHGFVNRARFYRGATATGENRLSARPPTAEYRVDEWIVHRKKTYPKRAVMEIFGRKANQRAVISRSRIEVNAVEEVPYSPEWHRLTAAHCITRVQDYRVPSPPIPFTKYYATNLSDLKLGAGR